MHLITDEKTHIGKLPHHNIFTWLGVDKSSVKKQVQISQNSYTANDNQLLLQCTKSFNTLNTISYIMDVLRHLGMYCGEVLMGKKSHSYANNLPQYSFQYRSIFNCHSCFCYCFQIMLNLVILFILMNII